MPRELFTLYSQLQAGDRAFINMAAQVIFNSTTEEAGVQGSLFQDLKFWLSQRVPQRARFINDIKVCDYQHSTTFT